MSSMFWFPADDDEETPEITHYDLIECTSDRKIGEIDMGVDGATPNQYRLMSIPYFQSVWAYFGGLKFDWVDDCWYPPAPHPQTMLFKAVPAYGKKTKIEVSDQCKKCKVTGTFVRTALVCPDCHEILGGF